MPRTTRWLALLLTALPLAVLAQEPAPEDEIAHAFTPLQGQVIGGVPIECDIELCRDLRSAELLLKVARLEVGDPLDPAEVGRAWSRLMRTGYFRRLEVTPASVKGRAFVRFKGVGHVTITELAITYGSWRSWLYPKQFVTEVRKRLLIKKGGVFPPPVDSPDFTAEDQRFLDRQRDQIVRLYEQLGYEDTSVALLPHYHGLNGKEVSVEVRVTEGVQPPMGQVLLKGNQAFSYAKALTPVSTGERMDFLRPVLSLFGVGRYDRKRLKEELKLVEDQYREEGFFAARVRLERQLESKGVIYPLVRINEGPQVEVVFVGNASVRESDLREALPFRESGAFDETEVQAATESLRAVYQAQARYYANITACTCDTAAAPVCGADQKTYKNQCIAACSQVAVEHLGACGAPCQGEDCPTAPAARAEGRLIFFNIDEGPKVYARRIELTGVKALPLPQVLGAMETKGVAEDGVMSAWSASSGVVQDTRLSNDLTAIRALYHEAGFPAVRFRCAPTGLSGEAWVALRASGALSPLDTWSDDPVNHRCFQVIRDPQDPGLVTIRVELSEGLRTTVDRFAIEAYLAGMEARMRDEGYALLQELGFVDELRRWKRNAGLNRRKLDALRGFLLRYFHQSGYLQAEVRPTCLGKAVPEGEEDCTEDVLYGADLDEIGFQVEPGPLTRVDGIILKGNLRTRPHILEAELLLKDGGPLGTDALFSSQANLRSLGIFDSVSVQTIGDSESGERRRATLLVTVEESNAREIDAYLGLQIDSAPLNSDLPVLFAAGASVRDRNWQGRALELGLGVKHANRWDTPQDLEGDDATIELGPFLNDRRFLGTRWDVSLETTYRQGRTDQRDRYEEVFSGLATLGYDFLSFSYPERWGDGLRATVKTEYRRDRLRDLIRKGERPPFGDPTHSLGLTPGLSWDRRDNPLHPTRGFAVTASAEAVLNGPDVASILSTPSFKETLTGQYVQSFFKRRLILVPALRLGAVQTDLGEADLKSDFLFKAGGDGVALPVRGYGDAVIDACQGEQDEGDCAAVYDEDDDELANPRTIGGRAMAQGSVELRFPTFIFDDLWFAAFSDAALVSSELSEFGPDQLFPSVGGGLRYLITGQIPLRLDVGYPLRRTVFEPQEARVHLNLFYSL